MTASGGGVLVVDAANVVGARPDGWWRDRAGAAERLVGRLAAAARGKDTELSGRRLVVVLEGRARAAMTDEAPVVEVVRAERDGDAAIVEAVGALTGEDVVVVTSDRALRERVAELGAQVRGVGWLHDVLDAGACHASARAAPNASSRRSRPSSNSSSAS